RSEQRTRQFAPGPSDPFVSRIEQIEQLDQLVPYPGTIISRAAPNRVDQPGEGSLDIDPGQLVIGSGKLRIQIVGSGIRCGDGGRVHMSSTGGEARRL